MKMNKKAPAILSAGHFVTDINQGALPVLLPFFKEALNLSYTMSGTILLATNITSSIIQPAFGHLSDKRPIGWLLPLSPFIACLGLSLTGFVLPLIAFVLTLMVKYPQERKEAPSVQPRRTGSTLFSDKGREI